MKVLKIRKIKEGQDMYLKLNCWYNSCNLSFTRKISAFWLANKQCIFFLFSLHSANKCSAIKGKIIKMVDVGDAFEWSLKCSESEEKRSKPVATVSYKSQRRLKQIAYYCFIVNSLSLGLFSSEKTVFVSNRLIETITLQN